MADTLKLNILSPERQLLNGINVQYVVLPGSEGELQILPGHAAMVTSLVTGAFSYVLANGQTESGFLSTGFARIQDEEVTVLAETLELKGEIDVSRAREAQQKAESALQDAEIDEHKFKKYQLKLQRSMIRQQIAGRDIG